jgi:hypothetical protein
MIEIRESVARAGVAGTLHDLALRAANRVVLIKILKCMAIERVNPDFATCSGPYRATFLSEPMLREFGREPENEMPEPFLDEALAKGDDASVFSPATTSPPTAGIPADRRASTRRIWSCIRAGITSTCTKGSPTSPTAGTACTPSA